MSNDLTPEERVESLSNQIKRNIYVKTNVNIELQSPWAKIKVNDLNDCELKRLLVDLQEKINKLLSPYAHSVMSEIIEQEIEESGYNNELIESQFDKLKEILNPPMTQEVSDAREDGYIFRDTTFKKFDNVEPEDFPLFMDNDVSFNNDGGLIILRKDK